MQQLRNAKTLRFCLKEYSLSNRVQTAVISYSPANVVHFSMYTTSTQGFVLNLSYSIRDLPSFALFGLTQTIDLQRSNIFVRITQELAESALLCFSCAMSSNSSEFSFVSFGVNVSGIVFSPKTFKMNQSMIQFRLNGVNVGGLIMLAGNINIQMVECKISGHADQQNISGSIVAFIFEQVALIVDNVKICVNVQNFGQGTLSQSGEISVSCNICMEGIYTYGLCQSSLEFGTVENSKQICSQSFVFDGEKCTCSWRSSKSNHLCQFSIISQLAILIIVINKQLIKFLIQITEQKYQQVLQKILKQFRAYQT
ncbi:Hypothetical_protein [Hexamita inflata]|uniref:Hypothetical_protein n=1 Tax=Hexamita inflata TaxID=28002 RepID=A0ABP1KHK3_9EUKA